MTFEIKHRYSGDVIFSFETKSIRLCVEAAVSSRASLARANLAGADLSGANLFGANLAGADLSGANLFGASLAGADLSRASLFGASLAGADLSGASLFGASLAGADLSGADLSRADLSRANLAGAKGVSYERATPLAILLDQVGKIRAYKLINSQGEGPTRGGVKYEKGKTVSAKANTDTQAQCAEGINLATLDWCMMNWRKGYHILLVEFSRKDLACVPIATDGKFRVHSCRIVGNKDLRELGLTE